MLAPNDIGWAYSDRTGLLTTHIINVLGLDEILFASGFASVIDRNIHRPFVCIPVEDDEYADLPNVQLHWS